MNTAKKLLVGSRNIDMMREEITQLIGMLQGLMEWIKIDKPLKIEGKRGYWKVGYEARESRDVTIQFYLPDSCLVLNSTRRKDSSFLPLEHVQSVYEDLETLVNFLAQHFPYLVRKLQPFVNAAEVVESQTR